MPRRVEHHPHRLLWLALGLLGAYLDGVCRRLLVDVADETATVWAGDRRGMRLAP